MSDFFEIYFNAFFISIPLTIYLIVLIIRGVKEILDILLNKKSIDILIHKADNISFEKLEKDIEEYSNKLHSKHLWTSEHYNVFVKKKELEKQAKRQYYKREVKRINSEINELENSIKRFERDYWISEFGAKKSEYELAREMRMRNLFNPQ
jgi:hypothetical protein